jgi:hypothetical protein
MVCAAVVLLVIVQTSKAFVQVVKLFGVTVRALGRHTACVVP